MRFDTSSYVGAELAVPLPNPNIRIDFNQQTTPETAKAIKRLLISNLWQRDWSEELADTIIQWRYCSIGAGNTTLAYDGDRPVAMVASSVRPYIMGQNLRHVREPFDWFCLPEYRYLGIGVWLMSRLMDEPEPLLAIGGSEEADAVLSTLGWQRLPDVRIYTLLLTTKVLVSKASHWLHCRPLAGFRFPKGWSRYMKAHLRRRQSSALSWHHLAPLETLPDLTQPQDHRYGLTPLVRSHEIQWMYTAPEQMGKFFCLVFTESSQVTGYTIGRLYCYQNIRYVKLIHIQTKSPSVEAYTRMLIETVRYVNDQDADVVQCRVSCPLLRRALRSLAFVPSGRTATRWREKNRSSPTGTFHLTFLRGDDGIRPYPE